MTSPTLTADGCPPAETLTAFARGELPATSLEGLAEHVGRCPRCAAGLADLDEAGRLLPCLRAGAPPLSFLDEPACAQLEERARAAGPAPAGTRPALPPTDTPSRQPGGAAPAGAFGNYVLHERLGGGGMGVVYKATQEPVHRPVALKMIRAGEHATDEDLARFRTEGEAIARLRHPNIIQLYEFGEHDGQPFFSMEFAEKGSLARRLGGGPLPVREAAELVRTLAVAVQAAHQERILHRDLKPANVLLMADGTPKVSDFGLAKLLDTDSGQTRSNAVLGTPAYMAPEQAAGRVRDLGPAVDVWALGVLLYECLTGHNPFRGDDKEDTLDRVRGREPERPSHLRPEVSRDLEAVCLKCLEKGPGDRYPTAAALAEDLGRWLGGRPVVARLRRWHERAWRGVRGHPLLAAAAALLLVAAAATPLVVDRLDPEYPRKRVERQLARGQSFVFEGHKGLPGPFRSVLGDAGLPKPDAREGCLFVETLGKGLVELVRDPQCDSYQLLVEMRHDGGNGLVGLYFGHQEDSPSPGVRQGSYFALTFAERQQGNKGRFDANGNPVGWVTIEALCFVEDARDSSHPHWRIGQPLLFRLAGRLGFPGPWRTLVVEVRPSGVEARWAAEDGTFATVAKASAQDLTKALEGNREASQFPAAIPTEFRPRSGLGLYVLGGRASVRRLVLTPLANGEAPDR
jgi:serine/threonine-protein kinase